VLNVASERLTMRVHEASDVCLRSVQTPDHLSSARNAAHLTDVIPCVATVWVCFQWRHLTGCVAHS